MLREESRTLALTTSHIEHPIATSEKCGSRQFTSQLGTARVQIIAVQQREHWQLVKTPTITFDRFNHRLNLDLLWAKIQQLIDIIRLSGGTSMSTGHSFST
jgi:hypothetical protein